MNQRVIYPSDEGGVVVVIPCLECGLSVEEIADKDVPIGKPYLIVSEADLPTDYMFFHAWEADFSTPHGHGIGYDAWINRSRGQ